MSIYRPYFYVIQDIRNDMYYAGIKYGKDANPEKFMTETGYHTTSKTIKKIISEYGLEVFIIRKIKLFTDARETVKYEKKFLKKVNARKNPRFYNGHNNDGIMDVGKMQEISMILYGVDHNWKSPEVRKKIEETMISKYGVPHYSQTKEYNEKIRKTSIEKYGVDHNWKSPKVRKKIEETMISKYGDKSYVRTEKSRTENLIKHGVEYTLQVEEVKEKIYNTIEEKYGERYYTQTKDFKEKKKLTSLEKYGTENPSQDPSVNNSRKTTNLEKYGTEEIFNSDYFKEKRKETSIERYGAESYMQSSDARLKRSKQYSGKGNPRYGVKYTLENKKKIYAHTQRPLIINGERYLFAFEAAEILQLDLKEIKKRLNSKKEIYSEWYYEDVGRHIPKKHGNKGQKRQNLAEYNKSQTHKFLIDGILYNSANEAAIALGINPDTVRRKSKSNKYTDWICIKPKKKA
jgi:hypothetical protein